MRLIDHPEYSTIWVGMWWAIQTVTTVGYGDVTPKNPAGRIVAALVMLEGVAFLAIITAAITSTFVQRASQIRSPDQGAEERAEETSLHPRFDELEARLERIEESLRRALPH